MIESPPPVPHQDFRLITLDSPFLSLAVGGCYARDQDGDLVMAAWPARQHANSRGQVHGGMILTLADVALGLAIQHRDPSVRSSVTIHLQADYLAQVTAGFWLELSTQVTRIGRSIGFAETTVRSQGVEVARAGGVFSLRRHEASSGIPD